MRGMETGTRRGGDAGGLARNLAWGLAAGTYLVAVDHGSGPFDPVHAYTLTVEAP